MNILYLKTSEPQLRTACSVVSHINPVNGLNFWNLWTSLSTYELMWRFHKKLTHVTCQELASQRETLAHSGLIPVRSKHYQCCHKHQNKSPLLRRSYWETSDVFTVVFIPQQHLHLFDFQQPCASLCNYTRTNKLRDVLPGGDYSSPCSSCCNFGNFFCFSRTRRPPSSPDSKHAVFSLLWCPINHGNVIHAYSHNPLLSIAWIFTSAAHRNHKTSRASNQTEWNWNQKVSCTIIGRPKKRAILFEW